MSIVYYKLTDDNIIEGWHNIGKLLMKAEKPKLPGCTVALCIQFAESPITFYYSVPYEQIERVKDIMERRYG